MEVQKTEYKELNAKEKFKGVEKLLAKSLRRHGTLTRRSKNMTITSAERSELISLILKVKKLSEEKEELFVAMGPSGSVSENN